MMATADDRLHAIQDFFNNDPPNILQFQHLPKLESKIPVHHEKMGTLLSWLGRDCIDTDIGHDGNHEPEHQPGSVHYFSTYLIFFMKIAEYRIPANFETEEGMKFESYTKQWKRSFRVNGVYFMRNC
jgi:hypothetical protein